MRARGSNRPAEIREERACHLRAARVSDADEQDIGHGKEYALDRNTPAGIASTARLVRIRQLC
jgi:hypothetical protein